MGLHDACGGAASPWLEMRGVRGWGATREEEAELGRFGRREEEPRSIAAARGLAMRELGLGESANGCVLRSAWGVGGVRRLCSRG